MWIEDQQGNILNMNKIKSFYLFQNSIGYSRSKHGYPWGESKLEKSNGNVLAVYETEKEANEKYNYLKKLLNGCNQLLNPNAKESTYEEIIEMLKSISSDIADENEVNF